MQTRLASLGQEIRRSLAAHNSAFTACTDQASEVTGTDGYLFRIGTAKHLIGNHYYDPSFEIWLDHFADVGVYRLWAGISGMSRSIKYLADELVATYGRPEELGNTDISLQDGNWSVRESKRPLPSMLAHYEQYGNDKTYYGFYFNENASFESNPIITAEALDFFGNVLLAFNSIAEITDDGLYPENDPRLVLHLRRERSRELADVVKRRDGYRCQACGFQFAEKYRELGDHYAEAHHLKALAQGERYRMSSVDDLTTLCANCHRMIHQLLRQDPMAGLAEFKTHLLATTVSPASDGRRQP